MPMSHSRFAPFARAVARTTGRPITFILAVLVVLVWLGTGPVFGYSDTWQLVINTGTTVVTFLMVFLIQSTQNRDTDALQLKLDEVIRSIEGAHNALLDLEELDQGDIDRVREDYRRLAREARAAIQRGSLDTDSPEVEPPPSG